MTRAASALIVRIFGRPDARTVAPAIVRDCRVRPGASDVTLTADVSGFIAPAGPAFAELRSRVIGPAAPAAPREPEGPAIAEVSVARTAPAAPMRPAAVPRAASILGRLESRLSAFAGASVATFAFAELGPPALATFALRVLLLAAALTLSAAEVRGVFGFVTAAEELSAFAATLVVAVRDAADVVAVRTSVLRSTAVVLVGVSVRSVDTALSVGLSVARVFSVRAATARSSLVRRIASVGGGVAVSRFTGGGVAGGGVAGTGVAAVTFRSGFGVGGGVEGGVAVRGSGVGGGVTTVRNGGGVGGGVAERGGVGSGVGVAAGVGEGG